MILMISNGFGTFAPQSWLRSLHGVRDEEQQLVPLQRLHRARHRPRDGGQEQGIHPVLHPEGVQTAAADVASHPSPRGLPNIPSEKF